MAITFNGNNISAHSTFKAATASAAGGSGLVPAPAAGENTEYLRGDGTWAVPTNTTYSNFVKSGSGAKAGLVPAPSTTAGTTKYLREDGTWAVPPDTNTTYTHPTYTARTGKPTANQTPAFGGTATVSQITSDAKGHVTGATDRTITIPSTLSNGTGTAGLIKTTSTVTSNSGYTACPVISGVPYYKDTNTTYTLSSFGITATSKELNYCDGVTSAIQTQLNGKAQKSHASTATTYGIGTASNYGHIKLSDTYSSKVSSAAAANGVGVSQNALYNAYSNILTNVILHNIVFKEFTVDNISIAPNAVATIQFKNTQRNDGYRRAMIRVSLSNATTNGAQSSACNIYHTWEGSNSESYSTCLVRNMHASATAVIQATARILYIYDCGASSFSSYFTPS